ncbi:MAG: hypothetical protein IT372_06670 [Polyangiaceae bacterium]|nr:hypothetical protein [Polyangiaceae bacterium]
MRSLALAALTLGLAGCFAPPSSAQRLTDAALDMNAATRFGRMDIALDHVGPDARADFARRHAAWGGAVRVVDLDFAGFDMIDRDQAEVVLNVTWLRQDESIVRMTRVSQRWRDDRGTWQLISEKRKDGDSGLLGEPPATPKDAAAPAEARPARTSFQTRVIREE